MMSKPISLRRLVSRAGIAIGVLFLASVVDTFVCSHLDGKYVIRALPGTSQAISGNLNQPVRQPEDVQFRFADPGLELTVLQVKGRFWRGLLKVPINAPQGVYRLSAFSGPLADPAAVPVYRVTIFPSQAAMNASYPSLTRRLLGIPPWWIAAAAAPLLAACLALCFYLVDEQEQMLAAEGLAPIVKLARHKDHWELAAAMAPSHAVLAGNPVAVVDRNRRQVALMTVTRIDGRLAFGRLDLTVPVRPDGYLRFFSSVPAEKNVPNDSSQ